MPLKTFAKTAVLAFGVLLVTGAFPTPTRAQEGRWPPPGVSFYGDPAVPDISGVWLGSETGIPGVAFAPNRGPADGSPPTYWAPYPLPYTPEYQKIVSERAAAAKAGRQIADTTARCLPFGIVWALVARVYPDEIVQTPGEVTIFTNSSMPHVIWTDGRPHPKDFKPSFGGHSIGHWVGDRLFVDTVGITRQTSIDHIINPHSDKLHIRWSIQRVAKDRLHFDVTLYDDDAFTEPVTTTNIWRRKTDPRWQVLDDGSCFENNRTNVDEKGNTDGFIKF